MREGDRPIGDVVNPDEPVLDVSPTPGPRIVGPAAMRGPVILARSIGAIPVLARDAAADHRQYLSGATEEEKKAGLAASESRFKKACEKADEEYSACLEKASRDVVPAKQDNGNVKACAEERARAKARALEVWRADKEDWK